MSFCLTVMFQKMSLSRVLMISVVFMTVAFFYTLLVIKQVRPHRWVKMPRALKSHPKLVELKATGDAEMPTVATSEASLSPLELLKVFVDLMKGTWQTFTQVREGRYRSYIYAVIVAFSFLCTTTAGIGPIEKLFVLKSPISWDKSDVATFNGYTKVQRSSANFSCLIFDLLGYYLVWYNCLCHGAESAALPRNFHTACLYYITMVSPNYHWIGHEHSYDVCSRGRRHGGWLITTCCQWFASSIRGHS